MVGRPSAALVADGFGRWRRWSAWLVGEDEGVPAREGPLPPTVARWRGRGPRRCCHHGHRMGLCDVGRGVCGGWPSGWGAAAGVSGLRGADGVLVGVPAGGAGRAALCSGVGAAGSLWPVWRCHACPAAGVLPGLAGDQVGVGVRRSVAYDRVLLPALPMRDQLLRDSLLQLGVALVVADLHRRAADFYWNPDQGGI